jgi:hypothetical protein
MNKRLPAPADSCTDRRDTANIFRELLAHSFDALPQAVQKIHRSSPEASLRGYCNVTRGKSLVGRAMAFFAKLPPAGENVPIRVTIRREGRLECWTRHFGGHEMTSILTAANGLLQEALGPVRFLFRLEGSAEGIAWIPVQVKTAGIPLPVTLFRFSVCERAEDGRYRFDVRVDVCGLGLLVHYQGWLEPDV